MLKHEHTVSHDVDSTICGKDYVGQTKDFRKRTKNHKSDIRGSPKEETLSIDKHPLLPARKISNLCRPLFSRNTVSLHQRTETKGDSREILHQKI